MVSSCALAGGDEGYYDGDNLGLLWEEMRQVDGDHADLPQALHNAESLVADLVDEEGY